MRQPARARHWLSELRGEGGDAQSLHFREVRFGEVPICLQSSTRCDVRTTDQVFTVCRLRPPGSFAATMTASSILIEDSAFPGPTSWSLLARCFGSSTPALPRRRKQRHWSLSPARSLWGWSSSRHIGTPSVVSHSWAQQSLAR